MSNKYIKAIPASLARRLAEAADGFRNVNHVYFIAGYNRPHRIKDFPDVESAEDYFKDKGLDKDEYGIFGPYKTTDDFENSTVVGAENIVKVDLTIHFKNRAPQQETLEGNIDSIYFNLSPLEKFVFPYYCHLFGVEYVKRLRDNLIAKNKDANSSRIIITARSTRTITLNLYGTTAEPISEELPD